MVFNSSRRGVETTQSRGGKMTIFGVLTKKYSFMKKSEMDYIYDVLYPICGSRPSYTITGLNPDGRITTFQESSCGHSELENFIEERRHTVCSISK